MIYLCVETRDDRIAEVKDYGIKNVHTSLENALGVDKYYDASIICSPTSLHIDQCNILSSKNTFDDWKASGKRNLDGIEILKKMLKKIILQF